MDECRLVREDVEYAISLIEHRPEQDTVDYKVFDVLNEAHEQLKKMEELLKWTRGCKYDCPYSRVP